MGKNMISECGDQYLGKLNFISWSLPHQIGSLLATAWFIFPFLLSLNIFLKLCQSFFCPKVTGLLYFLFCPLLYFPGFSVEKNIISLRVKKILFWQVANYRQSLHNFRAKWAVLCPEGTWSSHEGKWPHVSWKKLE